MDRLRNSLLILCLFGILIAGCYPQTTVILPPESTGPTAEPTPLPTPAPTTAPSTTPTTAPTSEPTTKPTSAPTSAPTSEPTTKPTSAPTTEPTSKPTTPSLAEHVIGSLEREVLDEINRRRTAEGVANLTIKKRLSAMAAIRARECADLRSSTRPDGRTWSTILSDHGSTGWDHKAEIRLFCSKGVPTDLLVETWMNTESAANNILSADYQQCGIGVKTDGSTVYVVVIFVG